MTQPSPAISVHELIRGFNLSGKTAVITGAASGVGMEIARALASAGAELILPVRDLERGSDLADKLIFDSGNMKIRSLQMDLLSLDSVRRFADRVMDEYACVDILIHSAGVMACPLQRSEEGYEGQFTINHLGHFLLSCELAPCLAESESCRVITLTSSAHHLSSVVFEDIHFERRPYDKWLAYGQSKTANALFTLVLNEQLEKIGGNAFAVNPGFVMTNLQRHLSQPELEALLQRAGKRAGDNRCLKTPAQGAATVVWALMNKDLAEQGGAYCEDCQIAPTGNENLPLTGVHPHARDIEAARRLWTLSEHMVDARFTLASSMRSRQIAAL